MSLVLERPSIEVRRFRPALHNGYQQELIRLVSNISTEPESTPLSRLEVAIEDVRARQELLISEGVPAAELRPTAAFDASLRLLRDLLRQGWGAGVDDEGVYLLPPEAAVAGSNPAKVKSAVRRSFNFARQAQLAEPATAKFIRDMERHGIGRLFESGVRLAERLERAARNGALDEVIEPVIEEVTPQEIDKGTGIRLQDIWRYARHLWSIPYQSTPGRNMFYLVRDQASERRPIIGIGALGNAVLGLHQRDEALGWTLGALERRLSSLDSAEQSTIAHHLVDTLNKAISDIFHKDLLPTLEFTHEAVERLKSAEYQALERRKRTSADDIKRTSEYQLVREAHAAIEAGRLEEVDWIKLAQTDLYTKKRAGTLASLIRALIVLQQRGIIDTTEALLSLFADEEGRRAVDVAIRQIKVRAIAENVMEIITCGSVPPYNEVLGGKLVAMLLSSPRVVADFRARYEGRVSLIASAMKAAPVYRRPVLALLTTSSLYSIGSSQYNRVRIPSPTQRGGSIEYKQIGRTDSFGTVHVAPDTAASLRLVATLNTAHKQVNYLFGEGTSPKLRTIRLGLDALGLKSDTFLRHHSPRILYAVSLCRNSDDILFGLDDSPDYILDEDVSSPTALVVDVWKERWLRPRVNRPETIPRLRALGREPLRISPDVDEAEQASSATTRGALPSGTEEVAMGVATRDSPIGFIEKIYRNANSYADRLTREEMEWLNVELGLDEYVLEQALSRKQVIVTGNPGDGKTHLIERLRPQLEAAGAVVLTDANAIPDSEVLAAWKECAIEGRPYVLAINEWPLFVLSRVAHRAGFPNVGEAVRQVQAAQWFIGQQPPPPRHEVVVVDLNLRNVLSRDVLEQAIDRLTQKRFFEGLPADDPALLNRKALRHERVQERLFALLDLVAKRSGHFTMRQVMGFLSYLITGGHTAVERLGSQGSGHFDYATLAFQDGEGSLFNQVRDTFDPARITHPEHDFGLWQGSSDHGGWIPGRGPLATPQQLHEEQRPSAFAALKRRFYFEHAQGRDLLELVPQDEVDFEQLLEKGHTGSSAVVRDLMLGLNRFFEPEGGENDRDELMLWQSHRYDVRPPDSFVALHRIPYRRFRVEPMKFAPWVDAWLPQEQRLIQSFALVAVSPASGQEVAQLVVDRDLYLTLRDAERGLGRASWSGSATRKVTRFIDHLHKLVSEDVPAEAVRVRSISSGLERRLEIQHEPPRYLL